MKRQPDGRFRGNRAKIELTDKVLISRWVEREVIRLKRMGVVSFETIADLLTQAGRGKLVPTVSLPPDVTFPPGYSISKMGCCKAYRRRLEREPSFEVRASRTRRSTPPWAGSVVNYSLTDDCKGRMRSKRTYSRGYPDGAVHERRKTLTKHPKESE
jgi:hypothetical protein